ncbi:hypothetical protein [Seonamhaeicola sp. ML3]|uniref:hypothetical protein n=1 Tax=Seonamhaeicola sp. ML3 TaxID=2937786 RepID=UPI00200F9906|nr:hypothetical protein [Seonamhaeicola sp. ML3]
MSTAIFKDALKVSNTMKTTKGELIQFENETYYKISNSDKMRPFFMSIVSDSNHWMFISSNGGLSAGRKNSEYALFPYYTDDKITESADITGSKSIFQVIHENQLKIWEPFSIRQIGIYNIEQNLYKNIYGNKIVFEEINLDLGLTFRYSWKSSNKFGFVKHSKLINHNLNPINLNVLDGLQNLLPWGVESNLQNTRSNLVDAYKRTELLPESGLGLLTLSAIIVDKAEPSEALKANTVWSYGIENPTYLLSSIQLNNFRSGESVSPEEDIKAEKGAYFINKSIQIEANSETSWGFVANVNQNVSQVHELEKNIIENMQLIHELEADVDLGTENLVKLTASSDGLQKTADTITNTRHFSNTLFNIMRGGIFDDNYTIEKHDFSKYLEKANSNVFQREYATVNSLNETFTVKTIRTLADSHTDADFKRLCYEYLPLKFSRRHGDPSRPWNRFSINTTSEIDGSKILDYEGNWRDIFQNWEALAHAYPQFIESMIHKFLNATTFDGYNPYRVTKDGFDWEVIEPDDPWSYIGYWGDHQIIYLLKFLEFIENHYPKTLENLFTENVFVYANVPYTIKSYEDILKNSKDTIDFNHDVDSKINEERSTLGADAALLKAANGQIYHVNLIEKLLATVLAKVSNFIPEGGIWLNTQRPEWNDANNALVGNGVSMVTLCYLQRFFNFFEKVLEKSEVENIKISKELATFFNSTVDTLIKHSHLLEGSISNKERKTILDGLASPASNYRINIYDNSFSGEKQDITTSNILEFVTITKTYLEHTIRANKRHDNMYHAYNIMSVSNNEEITIEYLSEMLEGQVAALSAGYLSPKEALELLDGLKASALFRDDQYSYILYPDKDLPRFTKKNVIPSKAVEASSLLSQLVEDGNNLIIEKDCNGKYHFNGNFNNANSLKDALDNLPETYSNLKSKEENQILHTFEEVFNHKEFTGRSGTFFGFEGLGSIYWHMVSKLLLAVQENCIEAINQKESEETIGRLLEHYYEIQAGIGAHKPPALYGAFPTDPYSHTPATKGAQQPGMTGQVKEDILSRIGELGVSVKSGILSFNPGLLRDSEFIKNPSVFDYKDIYGADRHIKLPSNSLAFTHCQIPIIYILGEKEEVTVNLKNNQKLIFNNGALDLGTSQSVFERKGDIDHIVVSIKK